MNRRNLLDARPANAFMLRRFFGADNFQSGNLDPSKWLGAAIGKNYKDLP